MSKAFGNPEELELAVIVRGFEIECGPASEVGRVTTQIDGNVPDVAGENADELSLWMTELVVKAAEDAARGERLVVLGEARGKTKRIKSIRVEDFSEPAAGVAVARRLQNFYVAQGGVT